ncbi:hypothetical protein Bbelb_142090 [Branchiostoma belcheri]|nr:hypothetical protein Bbelb_142090 [Branchiostoma belcheri]
MAPVDAKARVIRASVGALEGRGFVVICFYSLLLCLTHSTAIVLSVELQQDVTGMKDLDPSNTSAPPVDYDSYCKVSAPQDSFTHSAPHAPGSVAPPSKLSARWF